jgi:hypothetical protein
LKLLRVYFFFFTSLILPLKKSGIQTKKKKKSLSTHSFLAMKLTNRKSGDHIPEVEGSWEMETRD